MNFHHASTFISVKLHKVVSFRTISAILRGRWLIDKQWAESQLPLVLSLLNKEGAAPRTGNETESPFVIDPATMDRHELFVFSAFRRMMNPNIPAGSVAVLPVNGAMLKYNGECGEPGSLQRIGWLMNIEKNSNIGSAVLMVDSPGGQVDGTQSFANAVKDFSKPIIGFVEDGMAASAAMWGLSATDEAYASLETDQIGSIGVYTTLIDFRGALEMHGYKLHEIYAPQSTEKNIDYRDALAGNYDAVLADLKVVADTFIRAVKTNRGYKAESKMDQWSTGKMFYAPEAVKAGLIDGIKNFEQVVSKAAWLGKRKK